MHQGYLALTTRYLVSVRSNLILLSAFFSKLAPHKANLAGGNRLLETQLIEIFCLLFLRGKAVARK